jgi:hypothetical protein
MMHCVKARIRLILRHLSVDAAINASYVEVMSVANLNKPKVKRRHPRAVLLLRNWMETEADYDTQAWPRAKRVIENNRLSSRKRFNG